MYGHVLPQVGVGGERLVALGAGERLDLLVNPARKREDKKKIEMAGNFKLINLTCRRGCAC